MVIGGGVWFANLDQEARGLLTAMPRNADVFLAKRRSTQW
jgi:hypothetical protein